MTGDNLSVFGFDTMFKDGLNTNIRVKDRFNASGFLYLIEPRFGGTYNFGKRPFLSYESGASLYSYLFITDGIEATYLLNQLYTVNILGHTRSTGFNFYYSLNTDSDAAGVRYKRNVENYNILFSEYETEIGTYSFRGVLISLATTISMPVFGTSTCTSAKVDLYFKDESGNEYQTDINMSDAAIAISTGSGSLPVGVTIDRYISSGIEYLRLNGLNDSTEYNIKLFIKRFFL